MCEIDYFSQHGQDRFVDLHVFRKKRGGFFVDIGAYDGMTLSNTYALEKSRGWTGICVEPLPERFEQCRAARRAACVRGCIAPTRERRRFAVARRADMMSTLSEMITVGRMQRIAVECGRPDPDIEVFETECLTFDDIMEKHEVSHVDFCSIDTEGGELEILKSIDFDRYRPTCFTVEDNGLKIEMSWLMARNGYRLVERLGCDLVFVEKGHARTMEKIGLLAKWEAARRVGRWLLQRALRPR